MPYRRKMNKTNIIIFLTKFKLGTNFISNLDLETIFSGEGKTGEPEVCL